MVLSPLDEGNPTPIICYSDTARLPFG
jgi:hypothetical protein